MILPDKFNSHKSFYPAIRNNLHREHGWEDEFKLDIKFFCRAQGSVSPQTH